MLEPLDGRLNCEWTALKRAANGGQVGSRRQPYISIWSLFSVIGAFPPSSLPLGSIITPHSGDHDYGAHGGVPNDRDSTGWS